MVWKKANREAVKRTKRVSGTKGEVETGGRKVKEARLRQLAKIMKMAGVMLAIVASCLMLSTGRAETAWAEDMYPANVCGDGSVKCCVDSAILGKKVKGHGDQKMFCDNSAGAGVTQILNDVIDIMTAGVGVLGVIGITVVGVRYMTAGGSEEKTLKAKRRMFEIVIGLVAYMLIYAILKWLLPGFGKS